MSGLAGKPVAKDSPKNHASNSAGRPPAKRWLIAWAVLGVLAVGIAGQRWHTYTQAAYNDTGFYAVTAHELLQGRELYSDFFEPEPPGTVATYALAELVAGYGHSALFLIEVAAGVLTLLGVFAAAYFAGGGIIGALWAASFWALVSGDAALYGNQPTRESLMNVCLVWAFAFLAREDGRRRFSPGLVAVGLLWAMASLYKLPAVPIASILAIAYVASASETGASRRRALIHVIGLAAIGVSVWGATGLYFVVTHRFSLFWESVFQIAGQYGGSLLSDLLHNRQPHNFLDYLLPDFLYFAVPLLCLSVVGVSYGRRKGYDRPAVLVLASLVSTVVAVLAHGSGWAPYHWLLWLPVVCVGAGWCLGISLETALGKFRQPIYVAGIVVSLCLLRYEAAFYLRPPDDWSRIQMGGYGNVMIDARNLAHEIDLLLGPDETFCQLANEPELYYYSHRRPPTGFLTMVQVMREYYSAHQRFVARFIADIARTKPELLVITVWSVQGGELTKEPFPTVLKDYQLLPGKPQRGVFILLCRKGGALEKRLQGANEPATPR